MFNSGGKRSLTLQLETKSEQFKRRIIANLLGVPERVDWRTCAQTEDDERKDAKAFKEAFAAFDPSNF